MRKNNSILIILGIVLLFSFLLDQTVLNWTSNINFEFLKSFDFLFDYVIITLAFIGISFFLFKTKKSSWILPLWLSAIISFISSHILKLIIARPRILGEKLYPLINYPNFSFPSSHAVLVFSILPLLIAQTKRFRWYWLGYAVIVALSRILLKEHYLSDVIGAALIAWIIGILIYNLKKFK